MTEEQNGVKGSEMKFNFSGIFKSLEAVKQCLYNEKHVNLPEVQELLKIFNDNFTANEETVDRSQRKVFIVLEGIDASGKTTISQRLAKLIRGHQLSTPPTAIAGLRAKFDAQDTELRRAYYALGNYLAAQEVRRVYRTQPVIMDRFWHSTAAYALAQQSSLPPEGHPVYEWPGDLLKPDIVFFLSVSESKRLDRLLRRHNKEITREELRMKDDKELREKLSRSYHSMRDPPMRQIDSDVIIEDVLRQLKTKLEQEFQIEMPEIEEYIPENEKS